MAGAETTILDIPFDLIDYEQAIDKVEQWRLSANHSYITIANPHSVLLCQRDGKMRSATTAARLTLPDGIGIIWAAGILGYPHRGRVTGPELMLRLCNRGCQNGFRHFFYGGAEGVADTLAGNLKARFPELQVAGTYCPPFRTLTPNEDAAIVDMINAKKPDIIWVGLGAPKQEKWMLDHLGKIKATAMIGVGAAFDFHSGRIPWAPKWMRWLGVEWAYRLLQEPRRMWRRNVDSPYFLYLVLRQRLRKSRKRDNE